VYDLQEPFRWIADMAVVDAFESGRLDLPDFYFTGDDCRYRFETQGKRRSLDLLRRRFSSGTRCNGRMLTWGHNYRAEGDGAQKLPRWQVPKTQFLRAFSKASQR